MTERIVDFGPADEKEISDEVLNKPEMTEALGLEEADTNLADRKRPLTNLLTDEDFAFLAEDSDPGSESNRLEDEEVLRQLSAADAYPSRADVNNWTTDPEQAQTYMTEREEG